MHESKTELLHHKVTSNGEQNDTGLNVGLETAASSIYSSLLTTDVNKGIHDSWNTNTTTDSCRKEGDARTPTRSGYPSAVLSRIMNNTRKSIKTMILQFCLLIKMVKLVKLAPSSHGYCDQ